MIKVLNLYSGIGGNRKLWDNVEVTAVEMDKEVAAIYKKHFPKDEVVIIDAHQYLYDHYRDGWDFIWSSPPCQTHTRMNNLNYIKIEQGQRPEYPDMRLFQEIIFLRHWFKGKWVVENVVPYYNIKLFTAYWLDSHYFWANFVLSKNGDKYKRYIREHVCDGIPDYGFDLTGIKNSLREQVLNNCVRPETGKYVFDCAFKLIQKTFS